MSLTGKPSPESPPAEAASDSPPDPVGPLTRTILAGIAMRTGSELLKRGVDRGILGIAPEVQKDAARSAGAKAAETAAAKAPKRKSRFGAGLLAAAATRIATRSVPGAIVVGGVLLAKTLHERRRNRKA